jgi:hypothetical protein
VFTLTSSEQRDEGRLTKQFLRLWTTAISADVAWLLRLLDSGAMANLLVDKKDEGASASVKLSQFLSDFSISHVRSKAASAEQTPEIVADAAVA